MHMSFAALLSLGLLLLTSLPVQAQDYDSRREISCESNDGRYRECRAAFNGPAQLVRQLSDTRCVEGRNWGSRPGLVWVDQGCRGRFAADRQGWGQWQSYRGQREISCESHDERYRQCNADFRGRARIVRQLSNNPCIEGRTWGQSAGLIWVSRGCRARFQDTGWGTRPGGNDYGDLRDTVMCSSTDDRRRRCPWDARWGRPQLVEQISDSRCIEGRSWGFDGQAIWVDNGCRGRFGANRRY